MQKRRTITAGLVAAALLVGGAGAIAATTTMNEAAPQVPVMTNTPGGPASGPDIAEPGDAPDGAGQP